MDLKESLKSTSELLLKKIEANDFKDDDEKQRCIIIQREMQDLIDGFVYE